MQDKARSLASHAGLRAVKPEDFAALASLRRRLLGDAGPVRRRPQQVSEITLVAENGGALVGCVSFAVDGSIGEIRELAVDVPWQRQGLGTRLCARAEDILRGRGAERVRLASPPACVAVWTTWGYRPAASREALVVMEKALTGEWRNFYGRRHGKTLKDSQRAALKRLDALSPGAATREANPARQPLNLSRFGGRPLWLEIGFGGGEHLVHQAARHPEVQLIGAEPFVNGVAMLLSKIEAAGLKNVSVHPGDVRDLLEVLPAASVSRVFLLYPDPWPKRRHHRRRFVTAPHLVPLARVAAPGAELRIATDIPDYACQAREEVPRHGFRDVTRDEREAWPDWVRTRYEAKALREARRPQYLTFRRT